MTELFVDTSFVVALVNRRDQYHEQAVELSIAFESHPVITTDAILLEVGNALARNFKAEAVVTIEGFLSSDEAKIVAVDAALFRKGFDLYKSYQDKTWGLIDCISFVVMREHGITDALTTDGHFEQAGFNVLLKS